MPETPKGVPSLAQILQDAFKATAPLEAEVASREVAREDVRRPRRCLQAAEKLLKELCFEADRLLKLKERC